MTTTNTTTKPKDWQQMTWQALFSTCTPQEREEVIIIMLARIESRRHESLEVYRKEPFLLSSLSVPELRDVAGVVANDAHKLLLATYPGVDALLLAFECLNSFSMGDEETINYNDLADVISSLKEVWGVSTETKGKQA
jgi:hypothetical protein